MIGSMQVLAGLASVGIAVSACSTVAPTTAPTAASSAAAEPTTASLVDDCARVHNTFSSARASYDRDHGARSSTYTGSLPYVLYMGYLLPSFGSAWPTVEDEDLRRLLRDLSQVPLSPDGRDPRLDNAFAANMNAVEAFCPGSASVVPADGRAIDLGDVIIPSTD